MSYPSLFHFSQIKNTTLASENKRTAKFLEKKHKKSF